MNDKIMTENGIKRWVVEVHSYLRLDMWPFAGGGLGFVCP